MILSGGLFRPTMTTNKLGFDIPYFRIVFTYIIMSSHLFNSYGIKSGWYIGVEFFFLVSGYFLATEIEKGKFESPYSYTKYRITKFLPHYVFSFTIALIFRFFISGVATIKSSIVGYFFELLFLDMAGLNLEDMLNIPTWYLSVLIIAGFFLFALLLKDKIFYLNLFAPACILMIFSYLWRNQGMLQVPALGGYNRFLSKCCFIKRSWRTLHWYTYFLLA